MCRLFGLLGSRSLSPVPWLLESDRSLLRQSNVSGKTAQRDGWGIGWYQQTRVPRVEKGVHGAFQPGERERFETAARAAHGPVVLAHLRSASNPMSLPRDRLLALENSQPFTHGSALFIHNGEVCLPRETRPRLGKFESLLRGVNDSEVLFYLFTKHVEESGDPLAAYSNTRRELLEVWKGAERRPQHAYTGLNIVYSRGPNELWAFCHWQGEHGPAFLAEDQPYYRMGFETDAKSLLVGSEPFSGAHDAWKPLENGYYLAAQLDHGLVGVRTGPIP